MRITKTFLDDLTDEEAHALRQLAFSVVNGGEVPTGALAIMSEWIAAHGASVTDGKPVTAFAMVAMLSLLVREEAARRADARILYGGEKVRERMCPEHKGKWNGQVMLMGCPHGCGGTGWLRGEE